MREAPFSSLDHQFARFLAQRSGLPEGERTRFELLTCRLSAAQAAGHSCLEVSGEDEELLARSPLVSRNLATPLILRRGRLSLQRTFRYESRLAEQLKALAACHLELPPVQGALDACFGREPDNRQRQAAELALTRLLALVSGGPGTGKTATVARILGLLLLGIRPDLHIALAAPTGKAAMRLAESITAGLASLPFPAAIREKIPATASTLHRLLGVRLHSPHFRHHRDNPLPWDVVVVDEASMVDLALMSKLVDALKPGSRLILLGDKDQLASVESGAVLADCIAALPDNTVTLEKSYRFNTAISGLARAVRLNDAVQGWEMLTGKNQRAEVDDPSRARNHPETDREGLALLRQPMIDLILDRYGRYLDEVAIFSGHDGRRDDLRPLFAALGRFRVLCATRQGAGGVETINHQVELRLARLFTGSGAGLAVRPGGWYAGRPVIILTNDYGLNLFNGDVGICLPDPADPETLKVWFERERGLPASFSPHQLPACETVFAMTIHKSQGSEFTEVLVCLPATDSPLLTRELIYTAVTRARERVVIAGSREIFSAAVSRAINRAGGLFDMLTGAP